MILLCCSLDSVTLELFHMHNLAIYGSTLNISEEFKDYFVFFH